MTDESKNKTDQTQSKIRQMFGEVMLFKSIMVNNYLHDVVTSDLLHIAAIKHGAQIEFYTTGETKRDLNNLVFDGELELVKMLPMHRTKIGTYMLFTIRYIACSVINANV